MRSSIYISSEKIQLVGFAGNAVRRFKVHPLPEGTVINGLITEPAFLIEALSTLRRDNPDMFSSISLVVDGSSILTKKISAPKLNKRQYMRLVRDEFADSAEDVNELVCGYYKLGSGGKDKSVPLLGCVAGKSLVDSYVTAFKSAGIKLEAITIGTQAILNFVASRPELNKKTFVLNLIDGVTMLSMIFENGVNVFMSRSRLYGEEQEQLIQNMIENLSGLIQFNRSQKFDDIQCCYYLGLNENEIRLLDAFNPYTDMEMSAIDLYKGVDGGGDLPPDAHFVYLNTRLGKDRIDLIRCRDELNRHMKEQKPKKVWIPLLAALLILLALPAGYLYRQILEVDRDIAEIRRVLEDPGSLKTLEELNDIRAETARIGEVLRQYQDKLAYEAGQVPASSSLVDLATDAGDGLVSRFEMLDFSEDTNIMSIDCVSANEDDASQYIAELKQHPSVSDARYTGYSWEGSEYHFSVAVYLTPEEEK